MVERPHPVYPMTEFAVIRPDGNKHNTLFCVRDGVLTLRGMLGLNTIPDKP